MSLMGRLDEIRHMQGKDPLPDPTKIAGFEPGAPPIPPLPPLDPDLPADWIDPELDMPEPPPSPLIPKPKAPAPPLVAPTSAQIEGVLALVELLTWNGQPAPFSDEDRNAIRAITLRAFQRGLETEMARFVPRRARKPRAPRQQENGTPTTSQSTEPATAQPRKRGRPRGSLLKREP